MSDTEEKEASEATTSESLEEKVDKRKARSTKQLEALAVAREKAMEMRKGNAEHTKKAKEVKAYQKEEKRKEVERLYDEMVAKQNKEKEPKSKPEPEPEPALEHKVKRKPPARREPTPEPSDSESEHEPPLHSALTPQHKIMRIPTDKPPDYKYTFKHYH